VVAGHWNEQRVANDINDLIDGLVDLDEFFVEPGVAEVSREKMASGSPISCSLASRSLRKTSFARVQLTSPG
jgi:hypothetical protein